MRKLVVFVLIALIGAGAFAAWWFLFWVNPQTVVSTAFKRLASAKTAQNVRASISWDIRHSSGQGFVPQHWLSYSGSIDGSDPTAPKASGAVGYTDSPSSAVFQIGDAVVTADRVFFKPRDMGADADAWFAEVSRTSSTKETWFSFERGALLAKAGLTSWESKTNGAGIRTVLEEIDVGSWAVAGASRLVTVDGRRTLEVRLLPNANAIRSGLVALIKAWQKRNPTGAELDWASRSGAGVSRGEWIAVIDVSSRTVRSMTGTWPLLTEAGDVAGRVSFDIAFSGFNVPVAVDAPEDAVDLTSAIAEKEPSSFVPAGSRAP